MSFDRQYTSSSPVLTLPPQPSHQTLLGMPNFASQHAQSNFFNPMSHPVAPETKSDGSGRGAGRKRSRDEASINLEPDPAPVLPTQEPETDWVYGEGMVLIKPNAGYVADACSQSGTWLEEKEDITKTAVARQLDAQTVDVRNAKSQRVDANGSITASPQGLAESPADDRFTTPIVDDFTIHLGIGWRKLSGEEHIQAAARGWARYIENHYPLSNASIRLESKGLQSYLVEASEGFFLFSEDLRRARLVSQSVDGTMRNLQCTPPFFDGLEELFAAESPQPATSQQEPLAVDATMEMD